MVDQHSEDPDPLFDYGPQPSLPPVRPPSGDLKEVRLKAGYSLQELAEEVGVSAATIGSWERGRRSSGPRWRSYCTTLNGWAHPAAPQPASAPPPTAPAPPAAVPAAAQVLPPLRPATMLHERPSALGPEPGAVAVLTARNGSVQVHLPDGRSRPCPIRALGELPGWARAAGFTPWSRRVRGRIDPRAPQRPPLIALTASAVRHLGLPATCHGADRPAAEDALVRAGWSPVPGAPRPWPLLRRGPASVQLAVLAWDPGSPFHLPGATPQAAARLLGDFSDLLLPPCGPPAECTFQLMRTVRPALDAQPRDHAPQPVDATGPHAWWRQPDRVETRTHPRVIALALTMPLAAEANNVRFSDQQLRHHHYPDFTADLAGRWHADLSGFACDPGLPNPLAADGSPATGPAWYPAGTADYAHRPGAHPVRPIEAWLHPGPTSRHLTPWYEALRDARSTVMGRLGLDGAHDPADLAGALRLLPQRIDPHHRALLKAIAATEAAVLAPDQPSAQRPDWQRYARAELAARARAKLHQKLVHTRRATSFPPLAVTPHLLLFCAPGDEVFQIVPRHRPGQSGLALHLGIGPGRLRPVATASLDEYRDLTADLDRADPAAGDRLRQLLPADAVD